MDLEGFSVEEDSQRRPRYKWSSSSFVVHALNVVVERPYESSLSVPMRMMIHVMFEAVSFSY